MSTMHCHGMRRGHGHGAGLDGDSKSHRHKHTDQIPQKTKITPHAGKLGVWYARFNRRSAADAAGH